MQIGPCDIMLACKKDLAVGFGDVQVSSSLNEVPISKRCSSCLAQAEPAARKEKCQLEGINCLGLRGKAGGARMTERDTGIPKE